MTTLTIGSRRSQLAQVQSRQMQQQLEQQWEELTVTIELIDTKGDLNRTDPLPEIGGKGLFTLELEEALRQQRIDLAVHSLKDLPVEDSPGLTVVAIPARAAVGDLLVSRKAGRIEELPKGAVVGTSSLRRAAQVLAARPDLVIKDIRGNVETRLRKLDDPTHGYDAIVLAQAGLNRLELDEVTHAYPIPFETMLPAPGQGALGVQGRAEDPDTDAYLLPLDDALTRAAVTAERSFLAGLGGGCSLPVGALAVFNETGDSLILEGVVADPGGEKVIRVSLTGSPAEALELGRELAAQARAEGAADLLDY